MAYAAFRRALQDYESCRTRDERMRFFVRYASLAASPLNSQPWSFKIRGDVIELFADTSRAIPDVDPDGRLLYVSCGTVLRYMENILHCVGLPFRIHLFPSFFDKDLIAFVHLREGSLAKSGACAEDSALACAEISNGLPIDHHALASEISQRENVGILPVEADVASILAAARARAAVMQPARRPATTNAGSASPSALPENGARAVYHPDMMIDPMASGYDAGSPEGLFLITSFSDNVVSRIIAGRALGHLQLIYQPKGYAFFVMNDALNQTEVHRMCYAPSTSQEHPQLLLALRKIPATKPLPRRPVLEMNQ